MNEKRYNLTRHFNQSTLYKILFLFLHTHYNFIQLVSPLGVLKSSSSSTFPYCSFNTNSKESNFSDFIPFVSITYLIPHQSFSYELNLIYSHPCDL